MNLHLLFPAALASLLLMGCDKPKPEVSDRLTELEQRLVTAEQEAAQARAAQLESERLLEEQRLAVERDAIDRERMQLEQERIESERLLGEQARAAEEELRLRAEELANREQSALDLQSTLAEQQQTLEQREAELSDRDRDLAGREALPAPAATSVGTPAPEPAVVDVQVFYESLTPYGSWFDSADYGYVWRPTAYRTAGWRPYTHGRWACTDRGWMWISDEPFGWATYHYGRWALCRTSGWIWVPGNEWAPSWVAWRSSGSHIGWAPLPPETMAYRGRRWDSSVEVTFGIGSAWFSFVETRNFSRPIRSYCLPYTRNDYYWGRTANITNVYIHNNRVISGGPSYGDIARQTDRRPPFYRIEEDRTRRVGNERGFNRFQNGRIVVTPPRREESRNRDAVMNRPSRISGRLDNVEVVRTKPLDQEIVREFKKNREQQSRRTGAPPREITQRPSQRREEPNSPSDRGEEQRRLNDKARDLQNDARKNVDDRIRVLPRPAGPPTRTTDRGEEQRRLNDKARDLEKDARKNVDDRIRVLPRPVDNNPGQPRVPNPPPRVKPNNPPVVPRQPDVRKQPATPAPPPVLPRREESRNQNNSHQNEVRQQQRQAEKQPNRRANDEQPRQQQQRQAEESRRQQQRQAEENSRRQAEAQRENQRRQQQQAAEESRRQQQRQAEEQQRQQQQRAGEESRRQQQRQAEESSRRQEQQRQAEESTRRQQQQRQSEEQQRRNQDDTNRRNRR